MVTLQEGSALDERGSGPINTGHATTNEGGNGGEGETIGFNIQSAGTDHDRFEMLKI